MWNDNRSKDSLLDPILDRRCFLKCSAMAGAALTVGPSLLSGSTVEAAVYGSPDVLETDASATTIRSICLMCHSACGIQGKVVDGELLKVDGNPYHPNSFLPFERIRYDTDVEEADLTRAKCCVKSQSAMQTVYDPYRLRNPLKRVGPRGGGQWEEISWKQALDEIAEIIRPYYKPDTPIDEAFPEFGNLPNKVLFSAGRIEHGQKEFTDRIWKKGLGTANYRHDHTSICEVSHHVGYHLATDFKKDHFKPDVLNASYLIWFGTRPVEAGFPMQTLAGLISTFLEGGGTMVTVDPVFSNTAARSHHWLPIKPGTDAALALGMARWMIDNGRYDEGFLTNTKKQVNGESSYTDATFLVNTATGEFIRNGSGENMVWKDGAAWPAGSAPDSKGELDPGSVTVEGMEARTSWSLLVDRVREKTLDEYADICGIDASRIAEIAGGFSAAGKRGVADTYRGPVKHTNGVYNLLAINLLNVLNGNFDWKGGSSGGGGHWHETGGKVEGQVSLGTVPGGHSPAGVPISRHHVDYEKDAPNLFARDGYPAHRPWFPLNKFWNYQEILPSIKDEYPYPVDVMILYWNNMLYSAPASRNLGEEVFADEKKLPHLIAFDILIGETSKWADYILPDTTWLERWSSPHVAPTIVTKTSGFRQPLVGRIEEEEIDGKTRRFLVSPFSQGNVARDFWLGTQEATGPQLLEDVLIALGGRLGIPGVGAGAFDTSGAAAGYDWRSGLYSGWDWYQNILNNLAVETGGAVTVDEILAKGGVFEPINGDPDDPNVLYNGDFLAHAYEGILHLYIEDLATTKDSMTGETYDALPKYEPVRDVLDHEVLPPEGYDFHLISYRRVYQAQARTICNPWLQELEPEGFIEMNTADGSAKGLRTGDWVRLTSPDGVVIAGRVRLTEGMRPGVIGAPHSYGHWEMGSNSDNVIDGSNTAADPARSKGVNLNLVMKLDPVLGDVTLQDKIGASAAFYDSYVRVEPAQGPVKGGVIWLRRGGSSTSPSALDAIRAKLRARQKTIRSRSSRLFD